jgi:hypothetical protein
VVYVNVSKLRTFYLLLLRFVQISPYPLTRPKRSKNDISIQEYNSLAFEKGMPYVPDDVPFVPFHAALLALEGTDEAEQHDGVQPGLV